MGDAIIEFPFEHMIGQEGRKQNIIECKRDYVQMSIPKTGNYLIEALEEGWFEHRTLKTKRQMRKPKTHDKLWEHKVWSLVAGFDFEQLNNVKTSQFNLDGVHQIDVFAHGDKNSILIECKSKEELGKKSIRNYLLEMQGYKSEAESKLKKKYGNSSSIAWCIATRNFIIPKEDKKYAKDNGILLLNEGQVDYFLELQKRTGNIAKYQLLSYLFEGIHISSLQTTVPCLKTKLGEMDAYVFTIKPSELLPLSYISHRGNQDKDDLNAFQRLVSKSRLKSITEFVEKSNGFFPNSLLINIDSRGDGAKFQSMMKSEGVEFGTLTLPGYYKTAWIIDGQHRLLSFADSHKKDKVHVPIIAFHDMPESDQANMFVTINNKQKKVSQNVIIELNATLKWGSPKPSEMLEAMHARSMMLLNTDSESPIRNMIVLTGDNKKGKPFTTNTIVTAVKKFAPYGKVVKNAHSPGKYWLINSDNEKAMKDSCKFFNDIVVQYLKIFQESCGNWNPELSKDDGAFLLTNQGISSLFLILDDLITEYCRTNDLLVNQYKPEIIISWIKKWITPIIEFLNSATLDQLASLRKRLGLAGQSEIRYILEGKINEKYPKFEPSKLKEELDKLSDQWKDKANDLVDEMEESITKNVILLLKENYGASEVEWFRDGVPLEVQKDVMMTSLENKSKIEASFQITDLQKTVSKKGNYNDIFKQVYGLTDYPEKGNTGKDKNLSWFSKLNNLRKIVKHPVGKVVKESDFVHLRNVWDKIKPRIENSNSELN